MTVPIDEIMLGHDREKAARVLRALALAGNRCAIVGRNWAQTEDLARLFQAGHNEYRPASGILRLNPAVPVVRLATTISDLARLRGCLLDAAWIDGGPLGPHQRRLLEACFAGATEVTLLRTSDDPRGEKD